MRFVAFVCVSLMSLGIAVAEGPATQSAEHASCGTAACPVANCAEAERIRHLLEAGAHLAAAGKHHDAARLRAEAADAKERLLTAKLAEVAKLQLEIDQLRGELAASAQIQSETQLPTLSSKSRRVAHLDLSDTKESVLTHILRGELLQEDSKLFGVITGPTEWAIGDTEFLLLIKPSLVAPAPESNAEFSAVRTRYDAPAAPSSRREPHPPRPFQVPSYQTPIRR
jgi:hypothetical protein